MKKIKWSKIKETIPTHIKFKSTEYEIVWVNDFKDGKTAGETRFDTNQIAIKANDSDQEIVHTYFHELLHAASEEYDVGLSEKQVMRLEKSLRDWLIVGNVFSRRANVPSQRKRKNSKRLR